MPFLHYGLPTITPESYEKVKELFWVLAPLDGTPCNPFAWAMGKDPPSISVPEMEWRRPTLEETQTRQQWYNQDKQGFLTYAEHHSEAFHQLIKDGWRVSHETFTNPILADQS